MGLKGHPRNLHAGEALQAIGNTPDQRARNVVSALTGKATEGNKYSRQIATGILGAVLGVLGFLWLKEKPKQEEKEDNIENRQTPFSQGATVTTNASEGNWRAEEEKWRKKVLSSDKETNSTPQR